MSEAYDKPSPRMSAFAYFVETSWKEYKQENPGKTIHDFEALVPTCSDRWKTIPEEEKTTFQEMADEDSIRYKSEYVKYLGATKAASRNKVPVPKRPLPAFFLFSIDERPKVKELMPDSQFLEIQQELVKRWDSVQTDIRSKYEALAVQDKERYARELKTFKSGDSVITKLKGDSSKSKDSDEKPGKEEIPKVD